MKRSARTATVAVGLALGLVLTGCGEDASNGSSASDEGSSKLSGPPIKIFTIQQITVTNQDATDEAADAVKASIKRINANGGINGRPVEVEVCDDKFAPAEGANCARKAAASGAVAVIGTTTQQGATIYPVLEKEGICNLAPQPINATDYSSKVSYPIIAAGPINVAGYANALKAAGAKKIGVAYIDVATAAGVVPFIDMGAKNVGLTVGQKVPIPLTATDIAPVVAASTKGNDGVALVVAPAQLQTFARALAQQGSDVKIAASAADNKLIKSIGEGAKNLVVAGAFVPINSDAPGMVQFREDMKKQNPDAELNAFSYNGWMGVHVLKEVLEAQKVETINKTTVCDALSKAKDVDLLGTAPKWSTDVPFPIPGLQRIFSPFIQVQHVVDGQLAVLEEPFVNPIDPTRKAPSL
jgi:ABC-type branched-subunit amino acid transport system substrate-binding protein